MISYIPLLFIVVGALVYSLSSGKAAELGRLLYGAAVLVELFRLASVSVKVLG
jgi:hypothetical protein